MKSAPFDYHAPTSIDEAVGLLEPGGDVRVLAGGQSLMALMKLRRVKPRALVDINRVAGLDAIEERDGELVVGALVRQQTPARGSSSSRARWPLIREALQFVGYRATRHRGTVGGSLAFAAAWAELTAVAVALDATIEARSQRGARSIAAREFFRGPNETALGARRADHRRPLPRPPGAHRIGVPRGQRALPRLRAGRRRRGRDARRRRRVQLGDARAAARAPTRRTSPTSTRSCAARRSTTAALAPSTALIDGLDPPDDIEVSGSYRRRVAGVLARRALLRRRRARRSRGGSVSAQDVDDATPCGCRSTASWHEGAVEAAPDARRLPARGPRPDGHAPRLRARLLRQLQRRCSTGRASARASCSPCRPTAIRSRPSRGWPSATARSARCSRRSPSTTRCSAGSARRRC